MEEQRTDPNGMTEQEKEKSEPEETANYPEPDENWAHETVQELLDFWEEQGVYIRE
ncbi:MAG: hypothetical protein LUF34_09145 [Lachnospiraceae bacterium]|nr:hypothetical protein [Lachnospiraceae bacterium]